MQGVFDIYGKQIIPVQEQTIKSFHNYERYEKGYFYVTRNNKSGVYDANGEEIIPCRYYIIIDVELL
jgi:hypothetical protein